mmetsp:Transcript_25445/g.70935  ORF Transcript_25445/g.70935 Transcript_25445/m.70935 type:complete len:216 (-) Transcript_25445:2091-2738(-)
MLANRPRIDNKHARCQRVPAGPSRSQEHASLPIPPLLEVLRVAASRARRNSCTTDDPAPPLRKATSCTEGGAFGGARGGGVPVDAALAAGGATSLPPPAPQKLRMAAAAGFAAPPNVRRGVRLRSADAGTMVASLGAGAAAPACNKCERPSLAMRALAAATSSSSAAASVGAASLSSRPARCVGSTPCTFASPRVLSATSNNLVDGSFGDASPLL